jgi:NADH-quinone oxidoreductase subunit F
MSQTILVCCDTGCLANGARAVADALESAVFAAGIECSVERTVKKTGCHGFCEAGPLVRIQPDDIAYYHVKASDVSDIVQGLIDNKPVERLLYKDKVGITHTQRAAHPFYNKQRKIALRNVGEIDPHSLEDYLARGGYDALKKALTMTPDEIMTEMETSGLRGRGGAGFPTGRKWRSAAGFDAVPKYVVCNGDEGDPGAFMDRSLMEGNPHRVLEGMMIAARAIEADEGYVYVRAEYPLAVARIQRAVKQAEDAGILGENIFGSGRDFKIHVMEGAGAFVCGEETALIASIEGLRGMPRPKPPFPAQSGLWGKPTCINNVETLATVPLIIATGAEKFREHGTTGSPGTKTFALTGHVANTGLIEVPFGGTIRDIVYGIGGGVTDSNGERMDDGFKAVQCGGPSGGCLTADHLDLPVDFDSLRSIGAMVGSGGLVVMNKNTCMVQIAHFFMQFTQNESCGKCVPCREGTKQMLRLLDDIINGEGTLETIALLERVANAVGKGSLCGLGKTAPNPVLTTLKFFRDEYIAHVVDKKCPAGQCKALAIPEIDTEKCIGCGLCARKCPVDAITGEKKKPYLIDGDKCIKCGACVEACKFNAVIGM